MQQTSTRAGRLAQSDQRADLDQSATVEEQTSLWYGSAAAGRQPGVRQGRMRGLSKWWQRWVLDAVLTHPPPLLAVVVSIFLTVFAVGFWCAHWLDQVDLAVYRSVNVFSDNIRGENMLGQLCGVLPIDVVYTWVNGSDPLLLEGLRALSDGIQSDCSLSHCLPAPYISLMDSTTPKSSFESIPSVLEVSQLSITHDSRLHNFTMLHLAREGDVAQVMERVALLAGNSSKPKQAYWTSDVGGGWGVKQKHAVLVTGAAHLSHLALLQTLFPHHRNITAACSVSGSGGVQLVECREDELVPGLLIANSHLEPATSNTSIRTRQAMLMLQSDLKEIDANRFEDNECLSILSPFPHPLFYAGQELRYSLRSLEQHAPWVRRIFLVTNGQIPHWLNLDNPRLTIVTHQDIFPNASHLPTFSSPAIESHIHRIPGLSDHFLYLNDDVMLMQEVWPEDFFSPGSGFKVYLSWSLPECSSGCPGSWLGDGYCDASCNTSACEWDGGDCAGGDVGGDLLEGDDSMGLDESVGFCAPSCSDLWLADHYCDHSCNTLSCAFDGGDCGLEKVNLLHNLAVPTASNTTYVLPHGVAGAWMNLSSLLGPGTSVYGSHTEHPGIRTIVINTAQEVFFLLVKANITATLHLELNITRQQQGKEKEQLEKSVRYSLTVKCNTSPVVVNRSSEQKPSVPLAEVKNFTFDQLGPRTRHKDTSQDDSKNLEFAYVNVDASKLPVSLVSKVHQLEALYRDGELTVSGLKMRKSRLIAAALHSSKDHHLLYHKESDWPPKIKAPENVGKNTTLVVDVNKLYKKENEAKTPLKTDSKPVNTSNHLGARELLWDEHEQETNPSKPALKKRPNFSKKMKPQEKEQEDNGTLAVYTGSLPWEKQRLFPVGDTEDEEREPVLPLTGRRHLLDMFAESLLHVNRLFNSEYGYQARRVPAHMPHFISKGVMESLQEKFREEFELTSSHRIRKANDMQYAFSYYFYLMSEKRIRTPTEIFTEFDTDASGTLSDREIRTLLASLHDLPLHYNIVHEFHMLVKNCSAAHHTREVPTPVYERYADSDLNIVTIFKEECLLSHCLVVSNAIQKFICLNSNLDPKSKSNDLIHALVQDTYESLFPLPSSFELPLNYRNRFLYVEELVAWRKWRDFVRALIYACLASLVFLTLVNFFSTEVRPATVLRMSAGCWQFLGVAVLVLPGEFAAAVVQAAAPAGRLRATEGVTEP
ncbi:N-acetylglucosamine-1-phosphotransferase subunits alpha/beta [Portunus trituberculatus]|uniref:N-acetylglucosamine-1-phosphotransferase subunits alpha/beta n=1 Tax=Portunus trituberculatus TaxID=210409 RepID=A0A5B7DD75_PORTR|nr:N-acetylglucosamine-1-phosphotransferase subunits alpha/beta [Portunus trituberculatus]